MEPAEPQRTEQVVKSPTEASNTHIEYRLSKLQKLGIGLMSSAPLAPLVGAFASLSQRTNYEYQNTVSRITATTLLGLLGSGALPLIMTGGEKKQVEVKNK